MKAKKKKMKLAIIGNLNEGFMPHVATNKAI
jgi:hypothetical protein